MPRCFEIQSSTGAYSVEVGAGLFVKALGEYPSAIVLIDSKLLGYLPGERRIIAIDATEANKSLERIPEIIVALRKLGASRDSHLLVVGGGVIQDIATFSASIYMRGISWSYLPTTLLGMVDSCIGGKSSINVGGYKNIVGNFFPPDRILVDPKFIETLDTEMIVGGLYEAAKICYARSFEDFMEYRNLEPGHVLSNDVAGSIISKSLATKKWFIEVDEFDVNERLLLNFGHTFGHAMEAATDFGISHGIAVGLGMLAAIDFASRQGALTEEGYRRTSALAEHVKALLGRKEAAAVPRPPVLDLAVALEKFQHDKKHRPESYRVVVPQRDGQLELITYERSDRVHRDIAESYRSALGAVGWTVR